MKSDPDTTSRRRFVRRGIALGSGLLAAPGLAGTANETAAATATPPNETLKTIHSLRSIHGDFSEKQVRDEDLQTILEATVRAANASNMQSYSIVVVREAARIQRLTGYRGSRLLVYCVDFNRIIDTAKHLGYDFYADNLGTFITAHTNTILAAQTAVIAARSLGIDSLLTNGIHRGDIARVWEILDLPPKSCFPIIALILGYPKSEPAFRRGRLSGPGVIHDGKYRHLTADELDAAVRQHDDKSQHLGLVEDWDRHRHKHYFDWFFKDWDKEATRPAAKEGQIFTLMKKSGFIDPQGA